MKSDINTHARLFDLVRFMGSELHQADLITDEEYAWLCREAPMAKGPGSPSPRRLEDYDDLRAKMSTQHEALKSAAISLEYWQARTPEADVAKAETLEILAKVRSAIG